VAAGLALHAGLHDSGGSGRGGAGGAESLSGLGPGHLAAQTAAIRAHDTLERLGQIGAPTLVLVGAQDIVSPVAYAQILAAGIPAAKLKVLDSGGHAALFEYADAVNAALLTFLTA
jgi:pimeloyl-ACP methyl ester carboxylesterase